MTLKKSILTIAALFAFVAVYAQSILLTQPALSPQRASLDDLCAVQLQNTTPTDLQIKCIFTVGNTKNAVLVQRTSRVFSLSANTNTTFNALQLPAAQPLSDIWYDKNLQDLVAQIGLLPSQDYDVTVRVVAAVGEQVEMARLRYSHQIMDMGALHLVTPSDAETLQQPLPLLLWNCTLQGNLTYTVRMASIIGEQSAYDALRSNPLLLHKSNVPTTLLQYPIDAKPLQACAKYAWQVQAYNGKYLVGESESWTMLMPCRQLDGAALTLNENDKGSFGTGNRPIIKKPEKLYYGMLHNLEGGYYKTNDTLRVSVSNAYASKEGLKMRLLAYDPKTGDIGSNSLINETYFDTSFRTGDNRFAIPLTKAQLLPQNFYILEIRDEANYPNYLKFQYLGSAASTPDWKKAIDGEKK